MLLLAWFILVFILGAAVGSGLNVCIYRIPYEKSILWPSSHCGNCFQPVKWYQNIPLVSYWILRGRCGSCKATFSIRYFLIELFTGLAFVGLFWVDIVHNYWRMPWEQYPGEIEQGLIPLRAWFFWMGHALLVSLLIVTTFTDLDHFEIPMSVAITGMVIGLILSTCFPWPWPYSVSEFQQAQAKPAQWAVPRYLPVLGWQPWPVWIPIGGQRPAWLPPAGSWQLGLMTGLAGVLAGIVVLRAVRFLFGLGRGVEGLGLGDADLMMMAGAFVGWQIVLIAFFISVIPGLIFGLGRLILVGDQELPYGPSLAMGLLLTLFGWPIIGPHFAPVFFDGTLMLILAGAGAFFLLMTSFMLRGVLGTPPPQSTTSDGAAT